MNRQSGSVIAKSLIGFLGLISSGSLAWAQTEGQYAAASSADISSDSSATNVAAPASPTTSSSAISQPATESSPSGVESSIFSSLFMSGKTQDQFKPMTPKERLRAYAKGLFSPFHFLMAGTAAGITQLQDVPHEWGEGAEGYAHRFANYYAIATTSSMLQMAGEDLLHEDNFYYGSGEQGIWKRVKYAVKSSVLARGSDGTQHLSISQIGSTAGAAFISRLWQPKSSDSAGDGAVSFGIAMATNAGVNVIREFLPDVTRHLHRNASQ